MREELLDIIEEEYRRYNTQRGHAGAGRLQHDVVLRILRALGWYDEDLHEYKPREGRSSGTYYELLGPDKQPRLLVAVVDVGADYCDILNGWRECLDNNNSSLNVQTADGENNQSLLYVVVTDGAHWRIYPLWHGNLPISPVDVKFGSNAIPNNLTIAETAVEYNEWIIIPKRSLSRSPEPDNFYPCYLVNLREKYTTKSYFYLSRLWKQLAVAHTSHAEPANGWVRCIDLSIRNTTNKKPTRLRYVGEVRDTAIRSWSQMYVTLATWLHDKHDINDCVDVDATVYRSADIGKMGEPVGKGYIVRYANTNQIQQYAVRLLSLVQDERGVNINGYEVYLEDAS